jgi:ATP-dependent Clp protease ATP-binding subunit ClpC
VDFRNTVLILTTNIGAELIKSKGGFGFGKRDEETTYEKMKEMLHKEVERYFRPEFLNRLDDVIVFKSLSREDLALIVDYELRKVRSRLKTEHKLELELTEPARQFLIDKGYNPDFGARPLRRAIEQHVEDPLSEDILRGHYKGFAKIVVSVKETPPAEGEKAEQPERHLYFEAVAAQESQPPALQEAHQGT